MSINENMEFEAINKKVKERAVNVEEVQQAAADTYKEVKVRKTVRALALMAATFVAVVIVMRGINGLEIIGWINETFRNLLICVAGGVAMFNIGYLWRDIKY